MPLYKFAVIIYSFISIGLSVQTVNGFEHGFEPETQVFHEALMDATLPVKDGANYLRTGNVDFAALELEDAVAKWQDLSDEFGDPAPAPYNKDPAFAPSLATISGAVKKALTSIDAGAIDKAKETLAPLKQQILDIRKRVGIRLMADEIAQAQNIMAELWVFRHAAPDLTNVDVVKHVQRLSDAYGQMIEAIDDKATAELKKLGEYTRLIKDAQDALPQLQQAIQDQNGDEYIMILREIHAIERLLYLRFG
jgi:tetratricopeptide (TPR) repeat protein